MSNKTYTPVGEWITVQKVEKEASSAIILTKEVAEAFHTGIFMNGEVNECISQGDKVLFHTQGSICVDKELQVYVMHKDRILCKVEEG